MHIRKNNAEELLKQILKLQDHLAIIFVDVNRPEFRRFSQLQGTRAVVLSKILYVSKFRPSRSSYQRHSIKKAVLKISQYLQENTCEYCYIFKNIHFEEHAPLLLIKRLSVLDIYDLISPEATQIFL